MKGKEALFGVFCGVVGAALAMVAGSFAPLEAQNEVQDVEVGTITCRNVRVVNVEGDTLLRLGTNENGGYLYALEKPGGDSVGIGMYESGAAVIINGKDIAQAQMGIGDNEEMFLRLSGSDGERGVEMAIDEYGGHVSVFGRGNNYSRVSVGVNEYGNGVVSTWDKNRYRLADLE